MSNLPVKIVPLAADKANVYIDLGKKSYRQHYLDFWENRDPSPYIDEHFTYEVVQRELADVNSMLYLICSQNHPIGVLKLILNQKIGNFPEEEAVLLQKIYILKEYAGQGIGTKALALTEAIARRYARKVIWLYMMVEGSTLPFYLKNGYKIHSSKKLDYKTIKADKKEMYIMIKSL